MRRGLIFVLAILISLGIPYSSATTKPAIARFFEIEISHTSLGHFAGASEVWKTSVLLRSNGRSIGNGYWGCTNVIDGAYQRICRATYKLPQGDINLSGTVFGKRRIVYFMSIAAGTGVYLGREGVASFRTIPTRRAGYYGSQPFRTLVILFSFSQ